MTPKSDGLTELPAAEFAGFFWVALDPLDSGATLDVAAHLRPLADELDHRLIFPFNTILELDNVPEDRWDPFHNIVVIYALFPNIVLSVTVANGELFRIYPGDHPGRSVTVHQNSTPLDLSDESVAAGAQAVFDYAHATVRDEDYRLVEGLHANFEAGARARLMFGRNEPGSQHRHITWEHALDGVRGG